MAHELDRTRTTKFLNKVGNSLTVMIWPITTVSIFSGLIPEAAMAAFAAAVCS